MEKPKNKKRDFFEILIFILKVTFLGYGGGNALMPIIRKYAVKKNKWLKEEEFDDLVVATNMIPGPSVIETLSYISIKKLGKFWGTIVTLIGLLPHLILSFSIFILSSVFLPNKYLWIINLAIMPIIISILILFIIKYIKNSRKELSLPFMIFLILFSFGFCFFVPTPYNVPAIIMVLIILIVFIYGIIKSKIRKERK